MYTATVKKVRKKTEPTRNPLPLLQITLRDGGVIEIEKRRIVAELLTGLEYRALAAVLEGLHKLTGELIELATSSRILDIHENPVVEGPKGPQ